MNSRETTSPPFNIKTPHPNAARWTVVRMRLRLARKLGADAEDVQVYGPEFDSTTATLAELLQ